MKLSFYLRLSKKNITSSAKTFGPYIFAASLSIMMYIIIHTLSRQNSFVARIAALSSLMYMGVYIVGFFSCIFIFYGNKFLIKKRMKEVGLYMLLGLEKKHIAGVLLCEFLFCFVVALIIGSVGALLFGKLAFLLLHYAARLPAAGEYRFSLQALRSAAIVFGLFFALNYLYNLKRIGFAAPLTLMQEEKAGEKKPRRAWIRSLFAVVFLGAGYITSMRVQGPIEAFKWFLPAVIWVIAGTFFLFENLSIAVLTRMKKHPSYYTPKKFIAVSGMMYRMGQNAKGLASICILLTMVLVTVSFTLSISGSGMMRLKKEFPREHLLQWYGSADAEEDSRVQKAVLAAVTRAGTVQGLDVQHPAYIRYLAAFVHINNNRCITPKAESNSAALTFVPQEQLYSILQLNGAIPEALSLDELLIVDSIGAFNAQQPLYIGSKAYTLKLFPPKHAQKIENSIYCVSDSPHRTVLLAAKNEAVVQEIYNELAQLQTKNTFFFFRSFLAWDTDASTMSSAQTAALYAAALKDITLTDNAASSKKAGEPVEVRYRNFYQEAKELKEFEGGFLFLGFFFSILFLVWLLLVMYFKQISEDYEDRRRHHIMLKIGMDSSLIKQTSRNQIVTLFLLPVVIALVHGLFAEPILFSLLQGFGMTNQLLFFVYIFLTGGIVGLLYVGWTLCVHPTGRRSQFDIFSIEKK
ncbi:MAG: FtsX-like permease family protein [Treponema sp.]